MAVGKSSGFAFELDYSLQFASYNREFDRLLLIVGAALSTIRAAWVALFGYCGFQSGSGVSTSRACFNRQVDTFDKQTPYRFSDAEALWQMSENLVFSVVQLVALVLLLFFSPWYSRQRTYVMAVLRLIEPARLVLTFLTHPLDKPWSMFGGASYHWGLLPLFWRSIVYLVPIQPHIAISLVDHFCLLWVVIGASWSDLTFVTMRRIVAANIIVGSGAAALVCCLQNRLPSFADNQPPWQRVGTEPSEERTCKGASCTAAAFGLPFKPCAADSEVPVGCSASKLHSLDWDAGNHNIAVEYRSKKSNHNVARIPKQHDAFDYPPDFCVKSRRKSNGDRHPMLQEAAKPETCTSNEWNTTSYELTAAGATLEAAASDSSVPSAAQNAGCDINNCAVGFAQAGSTTISVTDAERKTLTSDCQGGVSNQSYSKIQRSVTGMQSFLDSKTVENNSVQGRNTVLPDRAVSGTSISKCDTAKSPASLIEAVAPAHETSYNTGSDLCGAENAWDCLRAADFEASARLLNSTGLAISSHGLAERNAPTSTDALNIASSGSLAGLGWLVSSYKQDNLVTRGMMPTAPTVDATSVPNLSLSTVRGVVNTQQLPYTQAACLARASSGSKAAADFDTNSSSAILKPGSPAVLDVGHDAATTAHDIGSTHSRSVASLGQARNKSCIFVSDPVATRSAGSIAARVLAALQTAAPAVKAPLARTPFPLAPVCKDAPNATTADHIQDLRATASVPLCLFNPSFKSSQPTPSTGDNETLSTLPQLPGITAHARPCTAAACRIPVPEVHHPSPVITVLTPTCSSKAAVGPCPVTSHTPSFSRRPVPSPSSSLSAARVSEPSVIMPVMVRRSRSLDLPHRVCKRRPSFASFHSEPSLSQVGTWHHRSKPVDGRRASSLDLTAQRNRQPFLPFPLALMPQWRGTAEVAKLHAVYHGKARGECGLASSSQPEIEDEPGSHAGSTCLPGIEANAEDTAMLDSAMKIADLIPQDVRRMHSGQCSSGRGGLNQEDDECVVQLWLQQLEKDAAFSHASLLYRSSMVTSCTSAQTAQRLSKGSDTLATLTAMSQHVLQCVAPAFPICWLRTTYVYSQGQIFFLSRHSRIPDKQFSFSLPNSNISLPAPPQPAVAEFACAASKEAIVDPILPSAKRFLELCIASRTVRSPIPHVQNTPHTTPLTPQMCGGPLKDVSNVMLHPHAGDMSTSRDTSVTPPPAALPAKSVSEHHTETSLVTLAPAAPPAKRTTKHGTGSTCPISTKDAKGPPVRTKRSHQPAAIQTCAPEGMHGLRGAATSDKCLSGSCPCAFGGKCLLADLFLRPIGSSKRVVADAVSVKGSLQHTSTPSTAVWVWPPAVPAGRAVVLDVGVCSETDSGTRLLMPGDQQGRALFAAEEGGCKTPPPCYLRVLVTSGGGVLVDVELMMGANSKTCRAGLPALKSLSPVYVWVLSPLTNEVFGCTPLLVLPDVAGCSEVVNLYKSMVHEQTMAVSREAEQGNISITSCHSSELSTQTQSLCTENASPPPCMPGSSDIPKEQSLHASSLCATASDTVVSEQVVGSAPASTTECKHVWVHHFVGVLHDLAAVLSHDRMCTSSSEQPRVLARLDLPQLVQLVQQLLSLLLRQRMWLLLKALLQQMRYTAPAVLFRLGFHPLRTECLPPHVQPSHPSMACRVAL